MGLGGTTARRPPGQRRAPSERPEPSRPAATPTKLSRDSLITFLLLPDRSKLGIGNGSRSGLTKSKCPHSPSARSIRPIRKSSYRHRPAAPKADRPLVSHLDTREKTLSPVHVGQVVRGSSPIASVLPPAPKTSGPISNCCRYLPESPASGLRLELGALSASPRRRPPFPP